MAASLAAAVREIEVHKTGFERLIGAFAEEHGVILWTGGDHRRGRHGIVCGPGRGPRFRRRWAAGFGVGRQSFVYRRLLASRAPECGSDDSMNLMTGGMAAEGVATPAMATAAQTGSASMHEGDLVDRPGARPSPRGAAQVAARYCRARNDERPERCRRRHGGAGRQPDQDARRPALADRNSAHAGARRRRSGRPSCGRCRLSRRRRSGAADRPNLRFRRGVTRFPVPGTQVLSRLQQDMRRDLCQRTSETRIEIGTVYPTTRHARRCWSMPARQAFRAARLDRHRQVDRRRADPAPHLRPRAARAIS